MDSNERSTRSTLLEHLMHRVEVDRYPSATILDMIEQLLTPDDVPAYARLLLEKAASDEFPSIAMLARVSALA